MITRLGWPSLSGPEAVGILIQTNRGSLTQETDTPVIMIPARQETDWLDMTTLHT